MEGDFNLETNSCVLAPSTKTFSVKTKEQNHSSKLLNLPEEYGLMTTVTKSRYFCNGRKWRYCDSTLFATPLTGRTIVTMTPPKTVLPKTGPKRFD